jgi:hypothetical protein
MDGFDFFRSRRPGYAPRTPAAALRGVGAGLLPPEYFIHASCSAKPLDEEPFDLEAIQRTLARTDIGVATARLLKGILEKLIKGQDQETALFGAEGINALESRYLQRIQKVRDGLGRPETPARRRSALVLLARLHFEMSELQGRGSSIRSFSLREAHGHLRAAMGGEGRVSRDIVDLLVEVLMGLGLHDQAAHLLEKITPADDPFVLLRVARVAFQRRDYRRVAECSRALLGRPERLTEAERRAAAFWVGE